jgi:hypothetical protein
LFPNDTSHLNPYQVNITSTLNQENFYTNEVVLFPNPTKNLIFFDNSKAKFQKYEIYDYSGRLVTNVIFNEISNQQTINLESLPTGIYKIILQNNEYSKTENIIKE